MPVSTGFSLNIAPSEKQKEFFLSAAKYTAYGGARGGGKSWALRYKLLLMCLRYGGIKILLVRRTLPELTENHIRPLREILAAVPRLSEYSEKDKCITFASGSRLQFGYLARESDLLRYQGQEFDVIAIDEATQISEHMFTVLCASLRGANDFPKRMYLTCNPGGIGHGWVKRLFIERRFRESENPDDYAFIPAGVYDNAALTEKNPDYIRQLENLPEELKKAWLYGSWDVFSGQFFPEFDYSLHTCEPFALGDGTMHFCAMDYGLDMLAALFIEVCRDGCAYVVSEIYESSLIISEAAGKILSRAAEGTVFIAPSDLWSRQKDSGRDMASIFAENGVFLTKLRTNRTDGWMALKEWLKPDGNGGARLRIFRGCENLIRSLPLLMHDKANPADVAVFPHEITHAPDALRYFASYMRDMAPCDRACETPRLKNIIEERNFHKK